jgi:hypothetical protein
MPLETPEGLRRRSRSAPRVALVVGGILVVEAVVIIGAMTILSGPAPVEAARVPAALEAPEEERITEILVLDDKLPNDRTGVTYLYETEIFAQVKKRYADRVSAELQQFRNEIRSEIAAIWRTAEPGNFQEPRFETLTRRVQTLLADRFGVDRAHDEPIISKCVIVMGTGMRANRWD